MAALEAIGHGALFSRLLALRGISPPDVADYLAPNIRQLATPSELPGAEAAAEKILEHLDGGGICVFGDYDCDGVSATAIMFAAINAIRPGAVSHFIPDRMTEGYGMGEKSVMRMLDENPGVRLVVTVDNGINSLEYVRMLKSRGIETIVTDHHLAGEDVDELRAEAAGFVNPKVSAPGHLGDLCGAGVAFMVANALVSKARSRGIYSGPPVGAPLLIMAGLATVTDIMPLKAQNRILVAEALRRFRQSAPIGLKELFDRSSKVAAPMTSRDFGFILGPRINAAGRMASGEEALALMLARDREEARMLAMNVDVHNIERKDIESRMTLRAMEQTDPEAPAQVVDLPDGHRGVAGIVASRILEKYPRGPVAVVVGTHGSCRAPVGFNVREILQNAAAALVHFGGHAQAGGFSVREGMIGEFRRLFTEGAVAQAARLSAEAVSPEDIWYDADVSADDLTLELAEDIRRLEPFGEGNEEPLFRICGVRVSTARTLGVDGRHLMLELGGGNIPRAVWWGRGNLAEQIRRESARPVDLLCKLELSEYGSRHVELRLVDMAPSEGGK